jgi:hypothetical protein
MICHKAHKGLKVGFGFRVLSLGFRASAAGGATKFTKDTKDKGGVGRRDALACPDLSMLTAKC